MAKPSRLSPMIMGPTAMTLGLVPLKTSGELGLSPMELSPIELAFNVILKLVRGSTFSFCLPILVELTGVPPVLEEVF